jgi:hypothetical protein
MQTKDALNDHMHSKNLTTVHIDTEFLPELSEGDGEGSLWLEVPLD